MSRATTIKAPPPHVVDALCLKHGWTRPEAVRAWINTPRAERRAVLSKYRKFARSDK